MKSLINKSNCHKIPFQLILLLIFAYICPNIRYPSVGENSFFPALIFLLSYSLFQFKELTVYIIFGLLSLLFPIYSSFFSSKYGNYSFISSLMTLYIFSVPVISSISLGRILGFRYLNLSMIKFKKEFKIFLISLLALFTLSAFLREFAPNVLYFFLHAGRTSHNRLAFFFTEPSQSSSILIMLFYIGIYLCFKNKFSLSFSLSRKYMAFLVIVFTIALTYLAQPLSLFAQLALIIAIFFSILSIHFFYNMFFKSILKLRIFNLKKSPIFYSKKLFLFGGIFIVLYYSVNSFFERVLGLFAFIDREGLFLGLMISAGNRFYYAFTSLVEGLRNPISLPGDWVGGFGNSLVKILSEFNLMPPDAYGLLQLYKQNPLLLKPSGWLYFGIYDLGLLGLLIASYFIFKKYLDWFLKGIISCDKKVILLLSIQISILLIPLLPSTPSAFLPLLISSIILTYEENKKVPYSNSSNLD